MSKTITKAVKITAAEYKCTSYYGNPSYYVTFEDESGNESRGYTASNAACGYGVKNFLNKYANITYHITRNGSLIIEYIVKLNK